MFDHRCTITRAGALTKSLTTGEKTPGALTTVASNIACRLSQGSRGNNTMQGDALNQVTVDFKLYLGPSVAVLAGDSIAVTYQGQTKSFEAGEPYFYKDHTEVPLKREADA